MSEGLKLLTVLAEPEIAERLSDELLDLGARGYSRTPGEGVWRRGLGAAGGGSDWSGPNVRLECVVPARVAAAIVDHLERRYFRHYAVFAFTVDAEVRRPDKYL